jgi:hypothetical protein
MSSKPETGTDFWSDQCAGRTIAVFKHHDKWLAYIDHVQQRAMFATLQDAVNWLTKTTVGVR